MREMAVVNSMLIFYLKFGAVSLLVWLANFVLITSEIMKGGTCVKLCCTVMSKSLFFYCISQAFIVNYVIPVSI